MNLVDLLKLQICFSSSSFFFTSRLSKLHTPSSFVQLHLFLARILAHLPYNLYLYTISVVYFVVPLSSVASHFTWTFQFYHLLYTGNCAPDYDICIRNKSGNIKKKQTNVGIKCDESTMGNSWQNKIRYKKKLINKRILQYPNH